MRGANGRFTHMANCWGGPNYLNLDGLLTKKIGGLIFFSGMLGGPGPLLPPVSATASIYLLNLFLSQERSMHHL